LDIDVFSPKQPDMVFRVLRTALKPIRSLLAPERRFPLRSNSWKPCRNSSRPATPSSTSRTPCPGADASERACSLPGASSGQCSGRRIDRRARWASCDVGFAFPGEPGGIPDALAYHDVGHVLTEYEATPEGEIQQGSFQGGKSEGRRVLLRSVRDSAISSWPTDHARGAAASWPFRPGQGAFGYSPRRPMQGRHHASVDFLAADVTHSTGGPGPMRAAAEVAGTARS
jgi:hypothetical protein